MKKGQTESYSFLIGIVLTILILTAVGCAVYQIYKPQSTKSFDQLTIFLKKLEKEEDQEGEMAFYLEKDELLLSFEEEQYMIEKEWIDIVVGEAGFVIEEGFNIRRPKTCLMDKNCLCLCKNLCKTIAKCESFDELAFIGEENHPPGLGVLVLGKTEGGEERGLASIHYSKQGNTISINDEK